jgi:hypothetical protein
MSNAGPFVSSSLNESTTATIAITVLSDHGSGGWRKAPQTGAKLANTHGCRAFSKAVNLTSISRGAASPHRQATSPLKAVLCFGNHTCPFNM